MRKLLTLIAVCLVATAVNGEAQAFAADDGVRLQLAQGNCPSLSEAVEQVRRQYNGRIVSAETQSRGNREVHVVKVLTDDGKVKTVRINGCSRGSRG